MRMEEMSFGFVNVVVIGNLCESCFNKMILKTRLEWPENEWEEKPVIVLFSWSFSSSGGTRRVK